MQGQCHGLDRCPPEQFLALNCLRVSTPRVSETPTAPLRGGVTDWGYEEVRGCNGVLVGRLGLWRKFRHGSTKRDYDCDTDHNHTSHYWPGSHYRRTSHY